MTIDEISKSRTDLTTHEYLKTVGLNIKSLRKIHKLTQMDVAFYLFTDKSMVSALERGVTKNMTLRTLIRLSELFKIKVEDLLQD